MSKKYDILEMTSKSDGFSLFRHWWNADVTSAGVNRSNFKD